MCIECIECIGSQAERLDSCHIRHIAIKLVKWINEMNCPCASSALSALGHKLTGWIPAILDILPQTLLEMEHGIVPPLVCVCQRSGGMK
ncbi:MAG: hypothetical protein EZS28_031969 [Streblomastix strix]|uniref:Uncharacterized protein n=1 Tax=Streblomastix strix TaxID=222440 RepID=A0A5J4UQC5_9EUKA|nr:MAG: hypothetical protein EZS28_031969 [Streblomastix strix]